MVIHYYHIMSSQIQLLLLQIQCAMLIVFFAIVKGCFDQHYFMQVLRCFVSIQAGNADDAIEECKYLESKGMILYYICVFVVPSEELLLKKNIMVRD